MTALHIAGTSWSLGVKIGGPIAAVIVFLALAYVIAMATWRPDNPSDRADRPWWLAGGVVALLIALAVPAGFFYPWSAEYHQWVPKHGTVAEIGSRFVGADKSTTQRFVVRLDDGGQYACDDTRCSLVKVGDLLSLSCKRHWQFAGTDGWDCNYVDSVRS